MKRPRITVTAFVAVVIVMPFLLATGAHSSSVGPFRKGVSLSPIGYDQSGFPDFFVKAKQAGSIVAWAGDWINLANEGSAPYVVAELASTYGYTPMIEAQFFSQSTGELLRPLDEGTKKVYLENAVAFASKYRISYLVLGIEVNVLAEKSPTAFDDFTAFYAQVYDAVKAASPDTKVFATFQLEKMKGLGGGLFGGTNDPSKAEWGLLDRFPKTDVVAFTTYPGLIFKDPFELPADYYSDIALHTQSSVAITESGWHTAPSPSGWEGSEAKQVAFVNRLFSLTTSLNMEAIVWSFLYDQNVIEPFNSMGLWRRDGTPKQAWEDWLNAAPTTGTTGFSSTPTTIATSTSASAGRCVIATAAYGSELAWPVQFLREFRDREVKSTYLGSRFILAFEAWYYSWSPPAARSVAENRIVRETVKIGILPLLGSLLLARQTFVNLAFLNAEVAIILGGFVAATGVGVSYLAPSMYAAQRIFRKPAGRRTFILVGLIGLILSLWGTLGRGSTEVAQNLTAIFLVEVIFLTPLQLTAKAIRFQARR